MVDAVRTCGGHVTFTVYPGAGHGIAGMTYQNKEFYDWLLNQRRNHSFTRGQEPPRKLATGIEVSVRWNMSVGRSVGGRILLAALFGCSCRCGIVVGGGLARSPPG